MLAYRHAFHAGNHADVLKHIVLVQVLRYMNGKDKPYRFVDTHAGAGGYSRKQLDELIDLAKRHGAKGLVHLGIQAGGTLHGPAAKFLEGREAALASAATFSRSSVRPPSSAMRTSKHRIRSAIEPIGARRSKSWLEKSGMTIAR